MPTAALLIDDVGPYPAECISFLSKSFSLSLSEVKSSVEQGKPVVMRSLFDRQNPPFLDIFAEALTKLDALECRYRAFELSEGETWDPSKSYYQLTVERLRNIAASHQSSLKHQRWLAGLEDPQEV